MSSNQSNSVTAITIIEDFSPETIAMLQAFYSRSSKPIRERLELFGQDDEVKVKAALNQFYIQYSHASIGDCGSTTIFIEGVSHFVAKAIQDTASYRGQESSTRYISYENQPYVNPFKDTDYEEEADAVILGWYNIYHKYLPHVVEGLRARYPKQNHEAETVWNKAISARAFDIMRGYLPAASTTQLSWHTDLRQARDNIKKLINHPLSEVRAVVRELHKELITKYGSSFSRADVTNNDWLEEIQDLAFYQSMLQTFKGNGYRDYEGIQIADDLEPYLREPDSSNLPTFAYKVVKALKTRPKKTQLPRYFETLGRIRFKFDIDFGSWRDLQRHRNAIIPMPDLPKASLGAYFNIHIWYVTQVRDSVNNDVWCEFVKDLADIMQTTKQVGAVLRREHHEEKELAYLMPLGVGIKASLDCSLPQILYMLELRTSQTVHPTLRAPMIAIAKYMEQTYPDIALYADLDDDKWSIKRGTQDIVKKEDM